jgi:hypothetical protein
MVASTVTAVTNDYINFYDFDYNTANSSTKKDNATSINALFVQDINLGAYYFKRSSSSNITFGTNIYDTNRTGTVNLWVKPNITDANQKCFFSYGNGGSNVNICTFVSSGVSRFHAYVYNGGGYLVDLTSNNTISNNTWYMITIANNNTGFYLYVNGSLSNFSSKEAWFLNGSVGTSYHKFGVDSNNVSGWEGVLDEVAVYDRRLTSTEILSLLSNLKNSFFNIRVYDKYSSVQENNFSAIINNVYYNTNNGTVTTNYNISNTSYLLNISIFNTSIVSYTNYTNYNTSLGGNFYLEKFNSIFLTIKDEITGNNIFSNSTVVIIGNTSLSYTVNNTYLFNNLTSGNYNILTSNPGYQSRDYFVNVNYGSAQNLTVYLLNTSYFTNYVVFTLSDRNTGALLDNVSIIMSRFIDDSWKPVEIKNTDITGRAQINFQPFTKYQFVMTKTGYENQLFYLNPIIFTSYTIRLNPDAISLPNQDITDVNIIYGPTLFYLDEENTFVYSITSSGGTLQNYNLTVNYPGGTDYFTGTNALGETFTNVFNISNATFGSFDTVNISYCFESTLSTDPICYNYAYEIVGVVPTGSWLDLKGNTYGMGLLERLLIVTGMVIVIAGLFTIFISPIAGGVLGLFIFGLFVAVGFIPLWGIIPSLLVGFFVLSRRSTQ